MEEGILHNQWDLGKEFLAVSIGRDSDRISREAVAALGFLGMSKARLELPGIVGIVSAHGWHGNGMGFKAVVCRKTAKLSKF